MKIKNPWLTFDCNFFKAVWKVAFTWFRESWPAWIAARAAWRFLSPWWLRSGAGVLWLSGELAPRLAGEMGEPLVVLELRWDESVTCKNILNREKVEGKGSCLLSWTFLRYLRVRVNIMNTKRLGDKKVAPNAGTWCGGGGAAVDHSIMHSDREGT